MTHPFGPWATSMERGGFARLSAFWRSRLEGLHGVAQNSQASRFSRRHFLAVGAGAAAMWALPTLSGRASAPDSAAEATPDTAAQLGRIYIPAMIVSKRPGSDRDQRTRAIVAIDLETGRWRKLVEDGDAPRVSPDGQTLAYALEDEGVGTCDTKNADNPGVISDKAGPPLWSPDGRHLIVSTPKARGEDGRWRFETWRINAAGGGGAPVPVPVPETDNVADWSPDGQWLLTETDRTRPNLPKYQLFLMKPDGTAERRLTHGGTHGYKARFSPDGRRIALYGKDSESRFVKIVDLDGNVIHTLVREGATSCPNGMCWSPDGKQVAVVMFDYTINGEGQRVLTGDFKSHDFRLEIVSADGQQRERLTLAEQPEGRIDYLSSWPDWR